MVLERFTPAFLLSIGITFGLFWMMTTLIQIEGEALPSSALVTVSIVNVKLDSPVETISPPPPVQQPIIEEPTPTEIDPSTIDPTRKGLIPLTVDDSEERIIRDSGPGLMQADGDAIPLVRVQPRYPENAMRRQIEGRVLVSFTISASGAVKNARVIAAEPSDIFNAAALKAVAEWRYEPRIVNGVPVEQKDIRISMPFRLDADSD